MQEEGCYNIHASKYSKTIFNRTNPHILHTDDKAPRQVEDCEQSVSHEGRGLQRRQSCSHKQSHGPAAIDHEPHQQEV